MAEWGDKLPTLNGSRLHLRWLTPDDAPALFAVFGDPAVTEFWSSPPMTEPEAAAELVREIHDLFAARTLFQWGIARSDTDEVIGTCTLCNFDTERQRAEIGFATAQSTWGRGYASEAVGVLLDFTFEHMKLHRIEADVDPRNEASIRLLEKHGFRKEGILRERWYQQGERHDSLFLGLLRHERVVPDKR